MITLTAVVVTKDGTRFERDLAPHFMHVAFWDIFPPWHAAEGTVARWSHRAVIHEIITEEAFKKIYET